MATAGRIALEGCKANPALCLNNVGIFVADAVAPEAAVGTGVLAAGAVKVLGNTKEGTKNLAEELRHASKPLLSNAKPDTHVVASLIENEKLYVGKGAKGDKTPKWKSGEGEFSQKPNETITNVEHSNGKYNENNVPYDKTPPKQEYVDILSPEVKQHILYGEKPGSGGHIYPGQPGKTAFPNNWSPAKIINDIGDIATSPNTKWYAQTGNGGIYTSSGKPARWVSYEVKDGVRIRTVYEPATGKVITAFPDRTPMPNYKPIKK
ncbi:EndoU domain-containing protein [Photorhabdus antumapuensis]|uniref:EndoU domain-containing protein n=1 Tax=Photorhabdus antumapuensis TaxID=2862867 RepID=UPI00295E9E9E|nr:EndoU domain-containing protein [Photorhabdus antumapuensis]MCA6223107.1 EndoU domain-containing protein [Photorhabdus antumapuensis]